MTIGPGLATSYEIIDTTSGNTIISYTNFEDALKGIEEAVTTDRCAADDLCIVAFDAQGLAIDSWTYNVLTGQNK